MAQANVGPVLQAVATDYNRKSKLEDNFTLIKKFTDARFGPVSIIQIPNNSRKIMVKEKVFNSKQELTNEIVAVKRRLGMSNINLLNILDFSTGDRSDFCSTFYWIKLFFEFPDHDLDQELKRRARFNIAGLNGDELTHMLYQVSDAGAYLNANGMIHGDICPQTIEVEGADRYKLVEKFGDLARPDDVQAIKIATKSDIYAAPEVYARNAVGVKRIAPNPKNQMAASAGAAKADVYSFGLTMLQAGVDHSLQGIYSPQGTINGNVLETAKQQFVSRFGKDFNLLVTTVMAMLEPNPEARPDFQSITRNTPAYSDVKAFLNQQAITNPAHNDVMLASAVNPGLSHSYYNAGINTPQKAQQLYNQYLSNAHFDTWESANAGRSFVPTGAPVPVNASGFMAGPGVVSSGVVQPGTVNTSGFYQAPGVNVQAPALNVAAPNYTGAVPTPGVPVPGSSVGFVGGQQYAVQGPNVAVNTPGVAYQQSGVTFQQPRVAVNAPGVAYPQGGYAVNANAPTIGNPAAGAWNATTSGVNTVSTGVGNFGNNAYNTTATGVNAVGTGVGNAATGTYNAAATGVNAVGTGAGNVATGAWDATKTGANAVGTGVSNVASGAWNATANAGNAIGRGVSNGATAIGNAGTNVANSVGNFFGSK